jgi:hypothetical protein
MMNVSSRVSQFVSTRSFLCFLCALGINLLFTPLWAAKIDPTVDHDACLSQGGIPQFTPSVSNGFPATPGTETPGFPLPNGPTGGHIGLVYTGCLLPDSPSNNNGGGPAPHIGAMIDLMLTGPRVAAPSENITARIHLSATNDGDSNSSTFTVQGTLSAVSANPQVINLPLIHSQALLSGRTRNFTLHLVIPADRNGPHVVCAVTNPTFGNPPVCFNMTIRKPNPNAANPVHSQ